MTRSSMLVAGVLWMVASTLACGGDSGNGTGQAGTGGGAGATGSGGATAGSSGTTGGAGTSGGAGGGSAGGAGTFMEVPPCTSEVNYVAGQDVIAFGMFGGVVAYDPKCLRVAAGTEVTFTGDFAMHPLEPSTKRGTLTGNPIQPTASGNSKAFAFPTRGFYAYFCETHAPSDTGTSMSGVIWVE